MWATSDTFDIGGTPIRVRANTHAAASAVRTALGQRVGVGDLAWASTFSIRLEPRRERGAQPLHVVYEGSCVLVRTRIPERAMRVLLAHLFAVDVDRAVAIVTDDGRATVLPDEHRRALVVAERRLHAAGLRLADDPAPRVTVSSVVVAPPPPLPPGVLDDLDLYRGTERGPAPAGSYALDDAVWES